MVTFVILELFWSNNLILFSYFLASVSNFFKTFSFFSYQSLPYGISLEEMSYFQMFFRFKAVIMTVLLRIHFNKLGKKVSEIIRIEL